MRKLLSIVVFIVLLFVLPTLFPSQIYAACDKATITNISPSQGDTDTNFTISGTIENCPKVNESIRFRSPIALYAKKQVSASVYNVFAKAPYESRSIVTDDKGNFSITKLVLPSSGVWDITIESGRDIYISINRTEIPTTGPKQITIIPGSNSNLLLCGQESKMIYDSRCPQECPSIPVFSTLSPSNIVSNLSSGLAAPFTLAFNAAIKEWRCGGDHRFDVSSNKCTQSYKQIDNIRKCVEDDKEITPAYTCDDDNYQKIGCLANNSFLCYKGDRKKENLVCTTLLPQPQCSDLVDYKDEKTGKVVGKQCFSVQTGLGIDISTKPIEFIKNIFAILLSVSGGIALLLIIYSGFRIMTSQGSKEGLQEARDRLTASIVGLLFLIFSLVIMQIIGVDLLNLPGLGK